MLHPTVLDSAETALLVVDMQEKLLPKIRGAEGVTRNASFLLDAAKLLEVHVVATEQYPKGLGPTVAEIAQRLPTKRAEKTGFSCCCVEGLADELRKLDKFRVVLVGIETHVCVLNTALDLIAQDFWVYLPVDALGSRYAIDHETALRRMESAGAVLTTAETTLFEWLKDARHPKFKEASALVQQRHEGHGMNFLYDVVLLTEDRYEAPDAADWYVARLLHEETLLREAIERRGLRVARVSWSNATFDWRTTRCAVFRSTWDYFFRVGEFVRWLEIAASQTRLINEASLVRWNLDKRYLLDLQQAGVAIPSTRFFEQGSDISLQETFERTGWKEAVLKPAISGAGRHTYRISAANVLEQEAAFRALLAGESMILQEFRPEILHSGESSLIFVAGRFRHGVRKIAKAGEFRVQDDHGGASLPYDPTDDEIAFAETCLAACPTPPLYARVDVLRTDDGRWLLMEMELIEPELFFRLRPQTADDLAEALIREARLG